jgi:nucleoside-diphosphate-sugar epimerase
MKHGVDEEGGGRVRVLVTGVSGFIGGAITRAALARGWEVTGVSRRSPGGELARIPWFPFDRLDAVDGRFDVLIHAAAIRHGHGVPPESYLRTNVALTERAIEVARRCAGRLVEISSIAVYGWPARLPIDETCAPAPVNPYAESKVRCEELVRASGVPFTIVQPSITYGPGDTNGMMEKILRMVARRRFVVPGLGRTRVQLVYIDDLAELVLEASASPKTLGERFICTYRDPIRVAALVSLASRVVGTWIPPVGPPTPLLRAAALAFELADRAGAFSGEPWLTREKLATISVDRAYRIDRMRALLGREPRVGYEEGVARTARALGLA